MKLSNEIHRLTTKKSPVDSDYTIHDFGFNLYGIQNAGIYSDREFSVVVYKNQKLIEGACLQFNLDRRMDFHAGKDIYESTRNNPWKGRKIGESSSYLKGMSCSLLSNEICGINYGHWMTDVLPRLHLIKKYYNLEDFNHFLVPGYRLEYHKESLRLLGIPEEKVISATEKNHFTCDYLVCTSHPRPNWDVPVWFNEFYKKNFNISLSGSKAPQNKFYASRRDGTWRKVLNEDKIERRLEELGFTILVMSEISFLDRIKLFSECSFFISVHGSSFSNTFFAPKGCNILEIFGEGNISPLHKQISQVCGLNYSFMKAKNLSREQHIDFTDIEINLLSLEEKLTKY